MRHPATPKEKEDTNKKDSKAHETQKESKAKPAPQRHKGEYPRNSSGGQ
jgi:hypothetical protein